MKISVFTPTHNPRRLARAARSLDRQSFAGEVEWVVLANGGATAADVRAIAGSRARVGWSDAKGIGALKREACALATGEVLVELDHDDELAPDALASVASAIEAGADFVYSDFAEVTAAGAPYTYDAAHGWQSYPVEVDGRPLVAMRAFAPTPAAMSRVWYAPNHLRAWRRDFYKRIGGHDASLAVLDDHDLVIRSYLAGRVVHLPRCLYVYHRTDGGESRGARNAEIQGGTLALHDLYAQCLVERWAELEGLPLVDLCGGDATPPGWTCADKRTGVDLDVTPWPWADGSVGAFRAVDALEHLRDPIAMMREIHRCLVPGGWLLSQTPSTDGRGAFQDPTHVSFWNANSAWYYTRAQQAKYIGTPVRFQAARVADHFPSPWHETHRIPYVRMDLVALKGDVRPPGLVEI